MFETAQAPDPLPARIRQLCDAIGAFVAYWGFKAIHGRVWALMAVHRAPLSQTAIASHLGVSRALVSATISELHGFGLVRPVAEGRTAPYEAVMDVWPTITDVLRSREWILLEQARLAIEAVVDELESRQAAGEPIYSLERLRFLGAMTDAAQTLLKTLIALRTPRAAPALRQWSARAGELIRRLQAAL